MRVKTHLTIPKPPIVHPPLPPISPTGAACPHCGAWTQVRTWVMGRKDFPGYWVEAAMPLTPIRGDEHTCKKNPNA